ncbi:MAG TPA: hypothetical protein V6D10_05875 [Trichocoleus sp.]|jgi:hypothetical protein
MTKPVTYYVQTPAINQLVAKYGDRLERLTREEQAWMLLNLIELFWLDFPGSEGNKVQDAWDLVADEINASEDTFLGLMEAIVVQLRHNSHQVNAEVGAIEPTKKAV